MTDCPDSKKRRIAIAENNPDLASTLALLLELQDDLEPAGVSMSGAGLPALVEGGADAVLLDLSLDDGSSVPLLRQLRDRWPRLAVVVFTGHSDPELARLCIANGADRVVVKSGPVDPLLAALRDAIRERAGR